MKFTMMKLFRRSKKSKSASEKARNDFNYDRDPRFTSAPDSQDSYHHGNSHKKNGHGLGNSFSAGHPHQKDSHFKALPIDNGIFAPWLELPAPILQRVFAFACPHSRDESYETCEQSAIEDACMLCDLRDLAHAGIVCKAWRKVALPMM